WTRAPPGDTPPAPGVAILCVPSAGADSPGSVAPNAPVLPPPAALGMLRPSGGRARRHAAGSARRAPRRLRAFSATAGAPPLAVAALSACATGGAPAPRGRVRATRAGAAVSV